MNKEHFTDGFKTAESLIYPNYKITWQSITMPSRRNGGSRRRWYRRICLVSSADSSDSSESEIYEPPPPVDNGEHHEPPPPVDTGEHHEPPPPVDTGEHHPFPSAAAYDWQLYPPPPPPFILDELPQLVRRVHIYVTEIARVEDDHREVIRNMEITEAITREKTICPICKEEFKLGEIAGKLPCDHFFCSECIHSWINFNQNNNCPVCRSRWPAVPPPPGTWEYHFPPVPFHSESTLVADETESSPPSINNSEAGYDTARDELDASQTHPQDSLASSTPTTAFPYSASGSTSS